MEIAGEDVETDNVGFEQDFGWDELDGVEIDQMFDVVVEGRQRQFGHEVDTVGDARSAGDDLVIGADEERVSGARTGVGVDGGVLEGSICAYV